MASHPPTTYLSVYCEGECLSKNYRRSFDPRGGRFVVVPCAGITYGVRILDDSLTTRRISCHVSRSDNGGHFILVNMPLEALGGTVHRRRGHDFEVQFTARPGLEMCFIADQFPMGELAASYARQWSFHTFRALDVAGGKVDPPHRPLPGECASHHMYQVSGLPGPESFLYELPPPGEENPPVDGAALRCLVKRDTEWINYGRGGGGGTGGETTSHRYADM